MNPYDDFGQARAHARAHHGHGDFRPPFAGGNFHHRGIGAVFGPMAQRARRGEVRIALLRLLSEQPMHGYQMIQELTKRSGGAWTPSAGSVYPTLQQLADEDLITSEEVSGKKIFSLTEAGKALVAESAEETAPWEAASSDAGSQGYREAAGRLMQVVWQVGRNGSDAQVTRATEILTEARKQLYALLAED